MKKILLTVVGAFTFLFGSAQISTFPHTTDFEAEALCGTSCTGTCNLTGHWRNADQYGFPQAAVEWNVDEGGTPSSNTGPAIDHTTGTGTGNYVYTESSGCTNVAGHLVSGIYDFSAVSAPRISFWYHMFGASMGVMHLDVDTTGLGNWVLDVIPGWTNNQNVWLEQDAPLTVAANRPSVRIRIRMVTGTSFTSDAAVDDITVYMPQPNDLIMSNVSVGGGCGNSSCTPVEISLINGGTATIPAGTLIPVSFEINSVVVTDTIVTATTINSGDTINYTFVNGCADLSGPSMVTVTAWSAWSLEQSPADDTLTITTMGIPIIATYPYFENFESGQNGWRINNGTTGTWAFGTPAKTVIIGAASGANCFVNGGLTGAYNNSDNSYVEGPCFDFSNICDPVLSVRVWWNSEFSWDGMNVTISTDGGNTWQLVGAFGDPLNWYNDNTVVGNPGGYQSAWSGRTSTSNGSGGWVTARHRLVGAGNQANVKIRFNFGSDGSVIDDGVAFDDVRIFNGTELGADMTICSPATATLNAFHGAGTTFLWNTGETTQTITVDTTGWYFVDISSLPACTVRDSVYIAAIDANSDVALGADVNSCAPYTQMLDAGYWPGSSYLWSTGDTTQMINVTQSGTYNVAVTTPCGILEDTIQITVNPLPVVALGNDTAYCGMGTLDAQNAGATYLWSDNSTSQTLMVMASGTYAVAVTDVNGCVNSDTVNVVVNALPVVTLGADTTVCGMYMLDAANAGATYMWSTGDTTQMITVTVGGTYVVAVMDSNMCVAADTVNVGVNALPVVNLGNDAAYCGSVTVDAQNAGAMYMWNDSTTAQTLTASASGTYSVMVTDTNSCSASDTINITINALPVVDLGGDTTLCGGSVTLDAGVAATYLWNDSTTAQTLVAGTTGTYYVTVTDSIGCTNSDSIAVTVNTPPTVTGTAAATTVCVDDADVALTGAPVGGTWSGPGVNGNNFDPSVGAGVQSLTYTYTDSVGCSGTASVTVTVDACVGVNEQVAVQTVNVYPNPNNGVFSIALNGFNGNTVVEVYDMLGKQVFGTQLNGVDVNNVTEVNLQNVTSGLYMVRVINNGQVTIVKMNVQR